VTIYRAEPFGGGDLQALVEYLQRELGRIGDTTTELILDELRKEPERPKEWLIVAADGVGWNPGQGAGVYAYYRGSWHKLG
jgi:hypothetical protein